MVENCPNVQQVFVIMPLVDIRRVQLLVLHSAECTAVQYQ